MADSRRLLLKRLVTRTEMNNPLPITRIETKNSNLLLRLCNFIECDFQLRHIPFHGNNRIVPLFPGSQKAINHDFIEGLFPFRIPVHVKKQLPDAFLHLLGKVCRSDYQWINW